MKQFKLFCLFIYLFSSQAFAQRGGSSVEQSTPPSTPLSFFAGYFDTGMLPENRITLDIPLLGLDYGVTDNFTIGTNAASSLLTSVTFQPYLFLKARYRFFSNKKISSVITGYGGYFNLSSHNNNPQISVWLLNLTTNTSYFFNDKNILTFHTTALKFNWQTGDPTDIKYYKIALDTFALGLGYQIFFTDDFGIEAQGLYSPYFNLIFDNPTQQISLNLNSTENSIPYFFRILVNYKTGNESNLSAGIWNFNDIVSGPWLGWQVLF